MSNKTGEADDTISLDSKRCLWVGPVFERLQRRRTLVAVPPSRSESAGGHGAMSRPPPWSFGGQSRKFADVGVHKKTPPTRHYTTHRPPPTHRPQHVRRQLPKARNTTRHPERRTEASHRNSLLCPNLTTLKLADINQLQFKPVPTDSHTPCFSLSSHAPQPRNPPLT